ncbi:Beta-lactamase/transpeptidase-like protein [Elaphomyces granulatus]
MGILSTQTVDSLRTKIDSVTSKPDGVPGLVAVVVDSTGENVFEYASGKRGLASAELMTTDTVFWVASCTKMITSIAAMQLVEQGRLVLDDVEFIERVAPELKDVKVLEEDPDGSLRLVEKKEGITLRMLLSHTAGFGYSAFNSKLKRWLEPIGADEISPFADILSQPLVNQPGSKWEYGISTDWVGEIIMRTSGLALEDYFQQYLFAPLGIKDISLFPSADMKRRLSYMHQRAPDGKVSLREEGHVMRWSLRVETPKDKKAVFNNGGAGCFAALGDFCKPHEQAQGWTFLGFLNIHVTPTGRGPRSIWWTGASNQFWWVDPEHGIGGIVGAQIFPMGDLDVVTTWSDIETIIFNSLA